MEVQQALVEGTEDAVPAAVTVILSPDSEEIEMHVTSDPLAVDPLLTVDVKIKNEVKKERISSEDGVEIKDEYLVTKPVSVTVPSSVYTKEKEKEHQEEVDPLAGVPNFVPSVLKSPLAIPAKEASGKLSQEGILATSTIESRQMSSSWRRKPIIEGIVEAPTLEETAKGAGENHELEGAKIGRTTRRSAAIALAAIRQNRLSNREVDSGSGESDFENSDEEYNCDENEDSEEEAPRKKDCGKRKGNIEKGAQRTAAPWCTSGMHSLSSLDKNDSQVVLHSGCQQNSLVQPTLKPHQMTRNTLTNEDSSLLMFNNLQDDFVASKTLAHYSRVHGQKSGERAFLSVGSNKTAIVDGSKQSSLLIEKDSVMQKDVLFKRKASLEVPVKVVQKKMQNSSHLSPEDEKVQDSNQLPSKSSELKEKLETLSTSSPLIDTQRSGPLGTINRGFEAWKNKFTARWQKITEQKSVQEENQYDQPYIELNPGDSVDQSNKKPNPGNYVFRKNDKGVDCSVCGVRVLERRLKKHLLKHSEDRPYKCKSCPEAFKRPACLRSHTWHKHNKTFLKCSMCEKQYKCKKKLKTHENTFHKGISGVVMCDVCGKSISKYGLKRHKSTHSAELSFSCAICHKKFTCKELLRSHIKAVHELRSPKHVCEVCGAVRVSPSSLKDHMNIHSGATPYICHVCNKCFSSKVVLNTHTRIHGEKKFKCDMCGYCCGRMDNLVTHIRSHTGEKPFKCLICSQTFTRLDNLQTHKRLVHKVEEFLKAKPA